MKYRSLAAVTLLLFVLVSCFQSGAKMVKQQKLADDITYSGEVLDGVPNGSGVMLWPDGKRYEGNFKNVWS